MSGEKKGKAPFYFTYLPCYLPSTPGATPFTPPDGFNGDANMRPAEGNQADVAKRAIGPESPDEAASSTDSDELSPRSPQPSSSTAAKPDQKPGRKIYDTWSQEEKQLLVHLWIGHYEKLQRRKDTRKAWQKISDALHARLGSSKGTEKCTKKMKYLIERYREAKDASSRRTDGFARKSEFYDEIDSVLEANSSRTDLYTVQLPKDVVTFRHVEEKRPSVTAEAERHLSLPESSQSLMKEAPVLQALASPRAAPLHEARGGVSEAEQGGEDAGQTAPKQDARTERKKSGKKRKAEEEEDEERKMLKDTFEKFQEQGDRMVRCMESFSQMQSQQVQMMNHFLGSMMQFMQSNENKD